MKAGIRASCWTDEAVFLEGTRDTFKTLAQRLFSGVLIEKFSPNEKPASGMKSLSRLVVEYLEAGKVNIQIEGTTLKIAGEKAFLEMLFENIESFGKDGVVGGHSHIDYHPDHFFLESDSFPLILELV